MHTENTTLKIQVKYLIEFIDLESEVKKDSSVKSIDAEDSYISYDGDDEDVPWTKVRHKKKNTNLDCAECHSPFQDEDTFKKHVIKHKKPNTKKRNQARNVVCVKNLAPKVIYRLRQKKISKNTFKISTSHNLR